MTAVFTWFDKSPPNANPTVPAPLRIDPGDWVLLSTQGHDRGELEAGRAVFTRQFYAEDFTDENYPTNIKSRLVRFRESGPDYTDEVGHVLSIDWSDSHTVEMNAEKGVPVGMQLRVSGPGPIFLTAWGHRGVSIAGVSRAGWKATLQGLVAAIKTYVDAL